MPVISKKYTIIIIIIMIQVIYIINKSEKNISATNTMQVL